MLQSWDRDIPDKKYITVKKITEKEIGVLRGSIRAGPVEGGGFAVDVELPWGRA